MLRCLHIPLLLRERESERESEMEGEIINFIKVCSSVFTSLCYCYAAGKIVPKGTPRLITIIPVVCLFLYLPLNLHSIHLGGTCAFFIAWLSNFKLLMFAFDNGPLSDPSLSLPLFLSIACFPIKIQQNPPKKSTNKHNPSQNGQIKENPSPRNLKKGHKSPLNYATKGLLLALMVKLYDYSEYLHPKALLVLYGFHIYFALEIMLAMVAALARTIFGFELEPQFNEPYLSTSLQDFWGRRWNMMVSRILRPTVYEPVIGFSTRVVGRQWAPLPAIFSTFVVSALMHELIFYYLGRVRPTWEITWFFLLHGVCLMVEISIKKAYTGTWRLNPTLAVPLTVGFVMVTSFWWFFPPLLRCNADVRAFEEYAAIGAFVKDVGRALNVKFLNSTTA